MENQDHLIPLFQKYIHNQCSPAEVAELFAYFRLEDDADLLRFLILDQLDKPTEETADERTFDRVFDAITAQIDTQAPKRLFYWIGIAASLLLVSSISLYLFQNRQVPTNSISKNKTPKADIAPGGNKAMLTLANGSVIILNGAKNGELVKQNSGIVNKTRDGEVVYQSSDQHATTELNTITTPRGGQYAIVLHDGSKVWLNAASSLTFPVAFTGAERVVALTGEAYFEVAKNEKKPFKVTVNGATVEVLGTHFNIMAYSEEKKMRTTLLEGSVKISKGNQSGLLKPGQMAEVDQQNNVKINEADAEQAMAWKNGYFKFNRDNIQTIMRQLSRWYDIDVAYEGKIPDDEFVGKIRRSVNASEVLRVLELSNVHFKLVNKKITVTNN